MNDFYLIWSGQSNAQGSCEVPSGFIGTSNEIEIGVKVWDFTTNAFIAPVWGTSPLSASGSNNAGIRCANEIYRKTGKNVYMILNAVGGTSIDKWIGQGTLSPHWSGQTNAILDQLVASNIPRIDAVGWMQGEADHDGRSVYDSYNTYKSALNTLLEQFRSLSVWQPHTTFITSGVGDWFDESGNGRNDVLLELNEWDDVNVGNISTHGCYRNPNSGQSSHFSHESLTVVGNRIAHKILGETIGDTPFSTNALKKYGIIVNQTLELDATDLKNGTYFHTSNSSLIFPEPKRYDGAEIIVNVTTFDVGLPVTVTVDKGLLNYQGFTQTVIKCNAKGQWIFKSMNNILYLISKPLFQNQASELLINTTTRTLNEVEIQGNTWRVNKANVKLPDPTYRTNMEVSFYCYRSDGATTISLDNGASSKFVNKTGSVVSSITLNNTGDYVKLKSVNTRWMVETQNF